MGHREGQFCPTRHEPGGGLRLWDGRLSRHARVPIIEVMVIDMNEAQVRTLEQVRQVVVASTQALV